MEDVARSARKRLGRTLNGQYHLREVIGVGGTAAVFRADGGPRGGEVAVKILHDHLSRAEDIRTRFDREGNVGESIDHPAILRVMDRGVDDLGCPYLVMELLRGESLEQRRMRCGGRIGLWEALDYLDQLLVVLEIAHARKIIHRDIKPSNLFLMKDGSLKVLDFGIARFADTAVTATKTGQTIGTPAFMAPEQALAKTRDIDERTDIWSVGATLFTLMSGEYVHISQTTSEHLVKAATLHARSLAKALPGVPANVEALVARCLAFEKTERFSNVTELREALAAVRDEPGRAIGTASSPPPERTPSNPNMPTIQTRRTSDNYIPAPPSSRSRSRIMDPEEVRKSLYPERPGDESSEDNDVGISITDPAFSKPKRGWVLPVIVGASMVAICGLLIFVLVSGSIPASSTASVKAANTISANNTSGTNGGTAAPTATATATDDSRAIPDPPPINADEPAPPSPKSASAPSGADSSSKAAPATTSSTAAGAAPMTITTGTGGSSKPPPKKPNVNPAATNPVYQPF